jgi:hypothetical protein
LESQNVLRDCGGFAGPINRTILLQGWGLNLNSRKLYCDARLAILIVIAKMYRGAGFAGPINRTWPVHI